MNTSNNLPDDVQSSINAAKALFHSDNTMASADVHYERIMETLTQVSDRLQEEAQVSDRYIFNQAEFVDALDYIVKDQLSALKKEKLSPTEWANRFNRWFIFCDAVANLGISCAYTQASLKNTQDYEGIFKTLKLNKTFETAFLKPRGIRVEMTHKSAQVKDKYPWLAMPCLIVKDEEGVEHQIAITPSPNARVWWLDVLISFHGSYSWIVTDPSEYELEMDDIPTTSIADPYMKQYEEKETKPAEPVITEVKRAAAPVTEEAPILGEYIEQPRLSPEAMQAMEDEVTEALAKDKDLLSKNQVLAKAEVAPAPQPMTWQPKSTFFQLVVKLWKKVVHLFR